MQLIKAIAIATLTLLTTGTVSAATVITGKFNVTKPEFTIVNKSGDLVSSVKEVTFVAEQSITDQYCNVTTDKDIALEGGTIESGNCLFEWTAPNSFISDGFSLKGTYPTTGDVSIGYTLSYYSGSDKVKTLVDSKTINAHFVEPVKPIITSFDLKLGSEWQKQGDHTNYNPNDQLSGVRIYVETRQYKQVISIDKLGKCTVIPNESNCQIMFPAIKLGHPASDRVGQLDFTALSNSFNSYWGEDELVGLGIDVPWSYLPSIIDDFAVSSMPVGYEQEKSVIVDATTISVENNTAKLVISKPSKSITGDWWAPESVTIKFTKNNTPTLSENVSFDGSLLYAKNESYAEPTKDIQSIYQERVGDKYVYTFDLSTVNDGYYSAQAIFTNSAQITTKGSFSDVRVNKNMPEINIFKGSNKLLEGSNFTFIEEMVFGTFNSYTNDITVKSISINGQLASLSNIKTGVVKIESIDGVIQGENDFDIVTIDSLGHEYSETIKLVYEPINLKFDIKSQPELLVTEIADSILTATQTKFSNYCAVTTNENDAIGESPQHSNLCYFEWVGMENLLRDGFKIKGMFNEPGTTPVGYKIYTYFGGEKVKTEIASELLTFEVQDPIPPSLISYSVLVDDEWILNNEKKVHNPSSTVNAISITTTPVNYTQKVIMPNFGSCLINTYETNCTIGVTPFSLGNPNYNAHEIGKEFYPLTINTTGGYWENEEIRSQVYVSWEYVDAQVEDFTANARAKSIKTAYQFDINGGSVTIENNSALVVVNKPSVDVPGTWWLPMRIDLKFITSADQQIAGRLALDGNTLFRNRFSIDAAGTIVSDFTGPEVINDKFVYEFDITNVPDGRYDVEVVTTYSFGTTNTKVFPNGATLARYEPQIGVFRNYSQLQENDEFYFDNELVIGGFNGYVNGVEITSVNADGQALNISKLSDGVVSINGLASKLKPTDTSLIEVEIKDSFGDIFNYNIPIVYAPIKYNLKLANSEHTPYRSIELVEIESEQIEGETCRFYSDRDMALKYARNGRNSCLFVWDNLPDSFEESLRSRNPSAIGYINDESFEVSNTIEVINENGESVIIEGSTLVITSQEPKKIEITPSTRNELIQGYYPIEIGGGEIVRMETESSKGSVSMQFKMNSAIENIVRNPSSRTGEVFKTTGSFDKPHDVKADLWDIVPVNFNAKYERLPKLESSQTINALVIPDKDIGLSLDFQNDQILTTDDVTAKVQLGIYNRLDGWTYDKNTMGEWEVYIGKYNRKEIPLPITDIVRLDKNGSAFIEMPMDLIGEESGTYVAVAKTVNVPLIDYEMHIQSSRTHFIVFKGTKIEGDLRDGQIRGRVPLRASANYVPEDRADSGSLGEVIWEKSEDGLSWVEDEEFRNTLRWRKTLDTEQVKYLRVKVENKFTNEWAITEPLKIVAYTQPDLRVEQTTEVLFNEAATFAVYDYETKAKVGDGVIEWSTDNRKTWFSGSAEESFYKDDFSGRDLNVRMKYHGIASDESLGDEAFREARTRYTYLRSPRFYFDIEAPELVEVGTTHTLKATVTTRIESLNSRVESEWVLPNGEVISDAEMELTFDKSMLNGRYFIIKHQAWIEGSKDETVQSTQFRIEGWEYDFPELELNMPATVNYMPSKMRANVEVARHFAPGVQYTYDITDKTGINILEQKDGNFVLQFDEVGMKNITFKVSNDRGQSKTISQFVQVLPRTPLEIEIVKTFSNEYMRYPLDVSLRTRVRLSHPDDRVINYKWFLDNEFYLETRRYRESIADMAVGGHNVKVEVETEFGQTGTQDFDVTVIPNTKPTGTIKMLETDLYYELHLNCEDADGRILATTWEINGETLTHSHNVIQFNKSKLTGTSFVIGRCYDDSYDYTEVPQTLN